ncbi:MAG TPA: RsbRD N-terminal domain-containing protein [Anaeromyxobacteraceae bacterium]|nr:RsbRD N-terminal domain-containing protein [Anaeromyxobacteraceae bacterium]
MMLQELMSQRRDALCRRWLEVVLAEYGELTAARWRREDPFGNPVGHTLAAGLPQLLEAIAAGGETPAGAVTALEAILRIRSVQDLSPSRAVGFVYRLREAVRGELAQELAGGALAGELAALDGRVERMAWLAFDVYVRLREQVFRLRQEELKRSVASLLRRWQGAGPDHLAGGRETAAPPRPPLAPGQPHPAAPALAGSPLVPLRRPPGRGSPR